MRRLIICVLVIVFGGIMFAENPDFKENRRIYDLEKNELVYLYVTILPALKENKDSKFTFDDVLKDQIINNENTPEIAVLFQEGDKTGPKENLYGFEIKEANATIKRRGHSSKEAEQASFKITLDKGSKLFYGQKSINLNKHPFDSIRMRNKLSFDIFKEIPGLPGLVTNFVHLYIKNTVKGESAFVDFGLFTQVENADKYYLKNHGLDEAGYLYKAEFFEFQRYSDVIKLKTDAGYQKTAFEKLLEIKGNDNHEKLIKMLDDVNNPTLDINQTIKKHFNLNNYLTWMAINILMENMDTDAQNFYLYSPTTSDVWYFLPWDFDGAWGFYDTPNMVFPLEQWKSYPVTNYWNNPLHRRFFQKAGNRELLMKKMEELLKNNLSKEKILEKLYKYKAIIENVYLNPPDSVHNDFLSLNGASMLDEEYKRIAEVPSKKMELFKKSLKLPMPFFIGVPEVQKDSIKFVWSPSYSFDKQKITYSLIISDTIDLKNVIRKTDKINKTEYITKKMAPGKYYIRVTAEKPDGNTMVAFDGIYDDPSGKNFYGIRAFEVVK